MSRIRNTDDEVALGSRTQSTSNISTAVECKDHKDIMNRDLQSFFLFVHLFRLSRLRIGIQDPVLLTPGSGILDGKKYGSGINILDHISASIATFFGVENT
jgi:hypothetical protein